MHLRVLEAIMRDTICHVKDAVAETNKQVLGKGDRKKLLSVRKKIRYMKRELDELDNICSLRLSYIVGGGINVKDVERQPAKLSDRLAKLSDRLAKLPEK